MSSQPDVPSVLPSFYAVVTTATRLRRLCDDRVTFMRQLHGRSCVAVVTTALKNRRVSNHVSSGSHR